MQPGVYSFQIKHPEPERAVRFAFVMVALALRELILFGRTRIFEDILPIDDNTLREELTRMFLSYLGVDKQTKAEYAKLQIAAWRSSKHA